MHGALGPERGVDDIADEQVHQAPAGLGPAEQDLRPCDGPGVVVDPHRQPEGVGQLGGERLAPPPQDGVAYDDALVGPDPAAQRRTDPEQRPPRVERGEETAQFGGDLTGQPGRIPALVGEGPPGQQPAPQVDEAEGRGGHTDVQPGGDGPADGPRVQVQGDPRPPHPTAGAGQFAQQPGPEQPGRLPRHGRRAQPAEPGDVTARDRSVVEHRPQHGGGIVGRPAVTGHTRHSVSSGAGYVPR